MVFVKVTRRRGRVTRITTPAMRAATARRARARNVLRRGARRLQAKRIKDIVNNMGAMRYKPLTDFNEQTPSAIQVGAKAFTCQFVLGGNPSPWTNMHDLGGIAMSQGTSAVQRIGDYVQLKKTKFHVNIDMKFNDTQYPPIEFRVVHCLQRRAAMPAGVSVDPATTLLLDTAGNPTGMSKLGINGTDLMVQPINKRDFIVYRDLRFTLVKPPHVDDDGKKGQRAGTPYRCAWNGNFSMNFPKHKCKYNNTTNLPENVPYHHFVCIFARALDKDMNADCWEVNTRGTTMYHDI